MSLDTKSEEQIKKEKLVQQQMKAFEPLVENTAGYLRITFPNLPKPFSDVIELNFQDYDDKTNKSDLKVHYRINGWNRPVYSGELDLRGPRVKKDAGNYIREKAPSFTGWGDIIDTACDAAIDAFRAGEPLQDIHEGSRRQDISYTVWPMIEEFNPTIVFGMGGLGKSLLACYLGVRAALGPYDEIDPRINYNDLFNDGLKVRKTFRVLYLDWEANFEEVKDRWYSICDGLSVKPPGMKYQRMYNSFTKNLTMIRERVFANNIDMIVVDSALPAAGGEAEKSQATENFFNALRSLKKSSLIIAHQAKPQEGREQTKPFGSIYWWNEGRSIWQIESDSEPGTKELELGLFHRKVNNGPKQDPLGYKIQFLSRKDTGTEFGKINISGISGEDTVLVEKLSIPQRIVVALRFELHGLTTPGISEKTGLSQKQIEPALSRGKSKGILMPKDRFGIKKTIFLNKNEKHEWFIEKSEELYS